MTIFICIVAITQDAAWKRMNETASVAMISLFAIIALLLCSQTKFCSSINIEGDLLGFAAEITVVMIAAMILTIRNSAPLPPLSQA